VAAGPGARGVAGGTLNSRCRTLDGSGDRDVANEPVQLSVVDPTGGPGLDRTGTAGGGGVTTVGGAEPEGVDADTGAADADPEAAGIATAPP
jgi:hypothetical protein